MNTISGERVIAQKSKKKSTLRSQLLLGLLAPILLLTLVSAGASYYYAFNFSTLAYDYSLFDSAYDISRQVHYSGGQLRAELPRGALDMLESDKHDRIYYSVSDASGTLIAGHPGLPPPPANTAGAAPNYYDGSYRGYPVRVAALSAAVPGLPEQQPVLIQVAETLNKRHNLAHDILLGMLLPELLLIVLISILVWYGIVRGLRPLAELQQEIRNRSHRDLSPLPEQDSPGEVRSLIRAMNDLLARLSGALSAQQRFITDAAHQLRTPLAGLKTQTELALRQHNFEDVQHTLQHLNTSTGQTTHLVNQLLSLARAEPVANRAQLLRRIDLNELARATTAEWVPHAIEHGIDLGFEDARPAADIKGDALLLKELLRNLLDNATRYTQRGGRVTVRVSINGDKVLLVVEDNGPGIPANERERVFERFHRVLGSGVDGCGLGLAIVREIAQGHNADTRLGPGTSGIGTEVSVVFPVAR